MLRIGNFFSTCHHCEDPVEVGKGTTGCPYCGAIYHETCWEEHFGCADPKCVGWKMNAPKEAKVETAATQTVTTKGKVTDITARQVFSLGWEKVRGQLGFFIGLQFVVSAILIILALIAERGYSRILTYLIITFSPFISAFFGAASLNIYIMAHDGKKPTMKDLFNAPNYWRLIWSSFLVGIVVSLGTVLLVLPGLFLAVALTFVPFLIIDQGLTIKAAFTQSYRASVDNFGKVLAVMVLGILLNILGAIPFGLGLLITVPVTIMALIVLYRTLL